MLLLESQEVSVLCCGGALWLLPAAMKLRRAVAERGLTFTALQHGWGKCLPLPWRECPLEGGRHGCFHSLRYKFL